MTDVSERLGVHRTTVQRWLKQYNEGGIWELLKIRYSPGDERAIPSAIVAELSTKISGNPVNLKFINKLENG